MLDLKDNILFYHKNCLDGYGSRWVFESCFGDRMNYIPCPPGSEAPSYVANRNVWIADLSFERESLLSMKNRNNSIILLDHHKTAEDLLKDLDFCHFNMNHCGSYLSWEHVNPGKAAPPLIQYIEDYDLWRWELPNSKEIISLFEDEPYSFSFFNEMNELLCTGDGMSYLVKRGKIVLHKKQKQIGRIFDGRHFVDILGEKITAVNSSVYRSELAEKCADSSDASYGLAYYYNGKEFVCSLRSGKEKSFDVSKIAVQFGGGGHKTASAFRVRSLQELDGKTRPKR
jgi:oligoribonuclease NrnB/cAMP/cGMP phosphodiesterase (DHH superfamily)